MKSYDVVIRLSGRYTANVEVPDDFDESEGFDSIVEAAEEIADGEDFGELADIEAVRFTIRKDDGTTAAIVDR